MLTNNTELDQQKVKISRPSSGKIDGEQVKMQLEKYGIVEEFYEIRSNPKKRTLVAAFTSEEEEKKMHEQQFYVCWDKLVQN